MTHIIFVVLAYFSASGINLTTLYTLQLCLVPGDPDECEMSRKPGGFHDESHGFLQAVSADEGDGYSTRVVSR